MYLGGGIMLRANGSKFQLKYRSFSIPKLCFVPFGFLCELSSIRNNVFCFSLDPEESQGEIASSKSPGSQ